MPFIAKGKTNLKYILIVVILTAIVGGGYWSYWNWQMAKQEKKLLEFPEIKRPEKVEKVEDETANWKTYRNEKYGFEVRYPPDWELHGPSPVTFAVWQGPPWEIEYAEAINIDPPGEEAFLEAFITIEIFEPFSFKGMTIDPRKMTVEEFLDELHKFVPPGDIHKEVVIEKTLFNQMPAIRVTTVDVGNGNEIGGESVKYYLSNGENEKFTIGFYHSFKSKEKYRDTLTKVISRFRFF